MHRRALAAAALLAAAVTAAGVPGGAVRAGDAVAGPIVAEVVRVVDGDTIEVTAAIWIGLTISAGVRIRGIDTPEMRGACPEEKAMAAAARDLLAEIAGGVVRLTDIQHDKYAGRVVADVSSAGGADLGQAMLRHGYARPYDGKTRADWCPVASIE